MGAAARATQPQGAFLVDRVERAGKLERTRSARVNAVRRSVRHTARSGEKTKPPTRTSAAAWACSRKRPLLPSGIFYSVRMAGPFGCLVLRSRPPHKSRMPMGFMSVWLRRPATEAIKESVISITSAVIVPRLSPSYRELARSPIPRPVPELGDASLDVDRHGHVGTFTRPASRVSAVSARREGAVSNEVRVARTIPRNDAALRARCRTESHVGANCHAGGRGFESGRSRLTKYLQAHNFYPAGYERLCS
jgi:hypothetical protein